MRCFQAIFFFFLEWPKKKERRRGKTFFMFYGSAPSHKGNLVFIPSRTRKSLQKKWKKKSWPLFSRSHHNIGREREKQLVKLEGGGRGFFRSNQTENAPIWKKPIKQWRKNTFEYKSQISICLFWPVRIPSFFTINNQQNENKLKQNPLKNRYLDFF